MKTNVSQSKPTMLSRALLVVGAAGLVVSWVLEGTFAYHTAAKNIMLGDLPVDVLAKTAFSIIVGFTAFAGAAVLSYLNSIDAKWAKRQAKFAKYVTIVAAVLATYNLASYMGWARRTAEYPIHAASVTTAQAHATLIATEAQLAQPMGYEERGSVEETRNAAAAVIAKAERPTGAEIPRLDDFLRAVVFSGIILSMAAAYRLPERQRNRRKAPVKKTRPVARTLRAV